jgi:hypothetical protein
VSDKGIDVLRLEFEEDNDFWPGYEMNVKCPGCHEPNGNHIDEISAEVRYDDAPIRQVKLALTSGELSTVQTDDTLGQHSRRRHSVTLKMWCEFCCGEFDISFAQHKGATLVTIDKTGEY